MDSITQIVLGAAVGEACLGKKLGNRAMFWGGVAGTIPDLDIFADLFLNKTDALAAHRGLSHSISFAIIGALALAWLLHNLYKRKESMNPPSIGAWRWMFFLCLFTHILLDCFTSYGTQIFAPFSDYRLALGTISVADPAYTIPFIICLVVAAFHNRDNPRRRKWNYAGLIISSTYLLFTVGNKIYINQLFKSELERQEIQYKQYLTTPTILNNQLWYCIAELDSVYMQGHYSQLDKDKFIKLKPIPKNHDWVNAKDDDHTMNVLKWFSKGFYNIIRKENGGLQVNDLRFGTFRASDRPEDNFVFRFEIAENGDEYFEMINSDGGPKKGDENRMLSELYKRWRGE